MSTKITALLATILFSSPQVQAVEHVHHTGHANHLGQAPAGVMGDHVHTAGDLMFTYSYMRMHMDGMRDGDSHISTADILSEYMVAPLRMDMEMHMFGAMYSVSDRLSLMAMVPLLRKDMDHITRMGVRFTTRSDGLGDISLRGVYALSAAPGNSILLNFGLSVPTGDIDASDDTPAAADAQLPYPMQLGSGTWDLLPGITWSRQSNVWSLGAQAMATIRLGDNDNDYTLGDRLELSGWVSRKLSPSLKGSLRLKAQTWDEIDGADPELNPLMVATADPELQGGSRVDFLVGVNFYGPQGVFNGSRLALEAGVPVYENLDGVQMSADWQLSAGWQVVF
ncbi:outer membrane putative beta-barrel porin/alpha-amylase [Thiogranum longum]|uniref:Outer membrane putative beta-barrel porin/alpha-amylase n=1 Tax=Thiogranum longum TaxID=1537524 RepID=A0A4V2PH41_9GAMM|nr:transporter [Thiogranum longum]TCK19296.1 outer membrane putative beta-barrel porin/alpha-amylase [Thiogranum longum]